MKKLISFVFLLGIISYMSAQTETNLFEWQPNLSISSKEIFLQQYNKRSYSEPTYVYKVYSISTANNEAYTLKITGFDKQKSDLGTFEGIEIYYNNINILKYIPLDARYDTRFITTGVTKGDYIKVPLSENSFALFFGGWIYGSGAETPEMVVIVVSNGKAKVVFDDFAFAYKYTSGENFAIEYVDDIRGLFNSDPIVFSESFLKARTKHKIWKEGNMLKYKSWK